MDDILPELEEMFEVELSIAAIFGDSSTGARLGNSSIAVVVVPESDDPYGLFRIAEGSRMVEVAEDVPTDQPWLGRVTVSVERTFGMLGDVEVREGGGEGRGGKVVLSFNVQVCWRDNSTATSFYLNPHAFITMTDHSPSRLCKLLCSVV